MKVAILSGSVYGAAEEVAQCAVALLKTAGFEPWHKAGASLGEVQAFAPDALLAVTSTTGMGELPGNLQAFYYEARDVFPAWAGKPFAVLALGDSSYDTFCGGGELMRELFAELGMCEALPMLRLDASASVTPEDDAQPWLAELAAALHG